MELEVHYRVYKTLVPSSYNLAMEPWSKLQLHSFKSYLFDRRPFSFRTT
jgi:hypothetical protein